MAAFFGMSVFVCSAIMHEWINFVAFNESNGENLIFFIVNGIATTAQIVLQKRYGLQNRKIGIFERFFLIGLNTIFFTSICKLFLAPYLRSSIFERESLKHIFLD
jgi:CDP-diglyceride synthetase